MINQTLNGRYRIIALVGEGAMGEVYRAADLQTGQEVAVKVITQKLAFDDEMLARFKREGEALRQLRHANIVAFVDMFAYGKQQTIVMEYVPGGSLHSLIKRGPLPVDQAVRIALELSDALAQAHHIAIIHRDIKPENVLMTGDGRPKLTDFGVARLVSETARLTGTGTQMGTPYYMSPEAWEGKKLDEQTDIWSLGVVLFEMLTGKVPFSGDTLVTVMNRVLTTPPPDLKTLRPDVPPAVVKIIQRMLTRDKTKRYASIREVALDLERATKEGGPREKVERKPAGEIPWKAIAIGGVGLAGLLVVGGLVAVAALGVWL
jgi:eukaryotic-like serine/threonine-protein kinase